MRARLDARRDDAMDGQQPGREPELAAVLQQFPPVAHAFAYGSGVFRQPGLYTLGGEDKPMLDFIFAVDAPMLWHEQVQRGTCWSRERAGGHSSCAAPCYGRCHCLEAPVSIRLRHCGCAAQNLEMNRQHYSFVGSFGSRAVRQTPPACARHRM